MRWRWAAPVMTAVVVVAVLALVRAGEDDAGAPPAAPAAYDPPATFAVEGAGVALPREADNDPLSLALDGLHAYVALPGRLEVIDTQTGELHGQVAPSVGGAVVTDPRAPIRATVSGRSAMVTAFGIRVPGRGTSVGRDVIELAAVDTGTYQGSARARIELAPSLDDDQRLRAAWPVAAAANVVVLVAELGSEREPVTYAVDLAYGTVRWTAPGLAAAAIAGGLVVGTQHQAGQQADQQLGKPADGTRVSGVRVTDGRPVWAAPADASSVTLWQAGPSVLAGGAVVLGTGARTLTFYDASGRVLSRRTVPGTVSCRFDGRQTTVCWHGRSGRAWAAAFDATTTEPLWELPDPAVGRIAPRVSTVWHGRVYGETDDGPLALDARTGTDLPDSPGIAPDLVNAYVGVVGAAIDRPRVRAYPASG